MKEIKTNYKEGKYNYSLCNGNDKKGWNLKIKNSRNESNKEFYERLVKAGYTKISFYEVTTCIKGLHEVIAYCK